MTATRMAAASLALCLLAACGQDGGAPAPALTPEPVFDKYGAPIGTRASGDVCPEGTHVEFPVPTLPVCVPDEST